MGLAAYGLMLAVGSTMSAQSSPVRLDVPASGTVQARISQDRLDRLAEQLGWRLTVISNHPVGCASGKPGCFVMELALTIPPETDASTIAASEFRFGFVNGIEDVRSDMFTVELVNGDIHAIRLKPGHMVEGGKTYSIRLVGKGHWFSKSFAMPNAYVTAAGLEARVIQATRPVVDPETGLDTLPFVTPFTDEKALGTQVPEDDTRWLTPERAFALYAERAGPSKPDFAVLPMPSHAVRLAGDAVDLARGVRLSLQGVTKAALDPALDALARVGVGKGGIPLSIAVKRGALGTEAYRLEVRDGSVRIMAGGAAGASYALRSLAQQAGYEGGKVRPFEIEDAPRLPFRGLHIDLSRNFHSREEVLKLVEQMAAFKLNKLHLHLGDDEGWRLEVPALPELTEVGAFRCADPAERRCLQPQLGADLRRDAPTNGFLSGADYVTILRAAKARSIEVIPSFDMPGHSRAAILSMEERYRRLMAAGRPGDAERYRLREPADATRYRSIQNYDDNTLNVCRENTYRFLDVVIDRVVALHRQAGAALNIYHIGADETAGAWAQSPSCREIMDRTGQKPAQLGAAFIERVSSDLSRRGIAVAGWSDGLAHTSAARMPKDMQSNIWGGLHTGGIAEAHDQLNRGWKVVLSMPDTVYLDMPNAANPEETGYDWGSRGTDVRRVFAFMPDNLPANAALVPDVLSRLVPVPDTVALQPGRKVSGLQAQLWSETVRTDARVDYMLFPRLLAVAERAWHRAGWEPAYVAGASYAPRDTRIDGKALERDWSDFAGRVGAQWPMLDRAGVAYRLAPPGARIVGGRLEAIAELPGLGIEYRVAGGGWQPYREPVAVSGAVTVRARSADGRRAGASATVEPR